MESQASHCAICSLASTKAMSFPLCNLIKSDSKLKLRFGGFTEAMNCMKLIEILICIILGLKFRRKDR